MNFDLSTGSGEQSPGDINQAEFGGFFSPGQVSQKMKKKLTASHGDLKLLTRDNMSGADMVQIDQEYQNCIEHEEVEIGDDYELNEHNFE